MTIKFIRYFAAVGVTAGLFFAASAKEALPSSLTEKLIKGDIAYLEKQLDKSTPEKRALPTVRATALMLATYAQDNLKGDNADRMAGLRAAAIKVAEAVDKKDYAGAKTLVATLKDAKGGDKAPIELHKQAKISIEAVMSAFRKGTVGGRNIEADLKAQAKSLTDVGLAAEIGGRTAAIALLSENLPPAMATGAKAKQWTDWSKEMNELGTSLAKEAEKGSAADKKAISTLLNKLEKNCVDCHKIFRD
ncbi:MAG: cytochrome c [Gemmataceae bacterium]